MRTVKWSAFLSSLCVTALALGMIAADARADVTTERGASILAFPKVLADGANDTIIQITNLSNSMVHARCFYVNAQLTDPNRPENNDPINPNRPQWIETDFNIWLTKQQPTHWRVSTGRFVNPFDDCFKGNNIDPDDCENAGIDPGAVPPVPKDFIGELKCVEVDSSDNPIGGNHLKGEATIKSGDDVAKYNAIGIEGTELAGETGNTLRLDQPGGIPDVIGQYNACPNHLILNHLAEGVTDPVVLMNLRGGRCAERKNGDASTEDQQDGSSELTDIPCQSDSDCRKVFGGNEGSRFSYCSRGPRILTEEGDLALRSATISDLTLIPCAEDFENQIPGEVTVQFRIWNEFETRFSTSTTVVCWKNIFLFQIDSPNNPGNSVFSFPVLGTTVATTVIEPNPEDGGVIGVLGTLRADRYGEIARTLVNLHIEGDRFTASDGEVVDEIVLPEP